MNDDPDKTIRERATRERAIRERAFAIWQEEGQPHGRADQHWQQACAELADAQARAARDTRSDSAGKKRANADKAPQRTSRNSVETKARASGRNSAPPKARVPSRAPRKSS